MLQAIRERAQSFIAWVIIILIAVPFAFWGIQNYFDVGKETPVAVVGDQELFQSDVNRVYQQITQNHLAFVQFSEEELQRQALEQLINDVVIGQISSDLGFAVSDQSIRNFNRSLPYFQTDGKFDKDKYRLLLASQGQSSAWFTEKVRRTLLIEQFLNGIMNSNFVTQLEINRVIGLRNQKREIDYLTVPLKAVESTIDDASIHTYYQNHQQDFKTPEQVSIEYVQLDLEVIASKVSYTENDLLDLYESSKESYTSPESRKVSHILVAQGPEADSDAVKAAKEKALTTAQRIKSGESFELLAKALSDDTVSAKNGGDLGLITPGVMEKNFEEAAFKLNEGELSDPVKTAFGYHLIKVTELSPSKTKPFEEVRKEIIRTFRRNEAENQFYELGEILAEKSYENPNSLQPAARALQTKIIRSGLFSVQQGSSIASDKKIREIAFSDDVLAGNNSEPIELGEGRVIVLRIKEHRVPTVKPVEEVKDRIVALLKSDQAKSKAKQTADEIYGALKKGESLDQLAQLYGLSVAKSKVITRRQKGISRALRQAVFKAPKPVEGQPSSFLVELENGDQSIVNLNAVWTVDPKKAAARDVENIKKELAQVYAHSLYSSVVSEGRRQLDVEIFKSE